MSESIEKLLNYIRVFRRNPDILTLEQIAIDAASESIDRESLLVDCESARAVSEAIAAKIIESIE